MKANLRTLPDGSCAALGLVEAGFAPPMTAPLPQGSDLAGRLQEVNQQLEIAKQSQASSLDQLRAFARKGSPPVDLLLAQADLGQLVPALPETMAQCMEELSSLQPAKEFTEALQVSHLESKSPCALSVCREFLWG